MAARWSECPSVRAGTGACPDNRSVQSSVVDWLTLRHAEYRLTPGARMPLKFLHFADTHLGQETYGRMDPSTGLHTRLTDFSGCLHQVIDQALEAGIDAALFAGDAYRNCYPSPTHQQLFAAAIGRLVSAEVPVVMITGNHDIPVAFGRATALDIYDTLGGQLVQVATTPQVIRVETRSGPLQVACLPWPSLSRLRSDAQLIDADDDALRRRLQDLCEDEIRDLASQLDPALPGVLLGHLAAENAVFSGSEKTALAGGDPTVSRGVLADPRFDYVALGHLHRHQDVNHGGRPAVVYSGSIERLDFGEARDPKGACLVTIGDGPAAAERETVWRHIAVAARPMLAIEIAVPPETDATAWIVERLADHDVDDAIVRVRYTCDDDQAASLDIAAMRRALEDAHVVAGLIRERPPESRRPRVEVTEHHGVQDALARYLETRPELAPRRDEIQAAAETLERELASSEAAGLEEQSP